MINKLLMGIFKIIISLVNVILTPINLLITNAIPGLDNAFSTIENLFNTGFQYIGWVVDASMLSTECISLIIATLTFRLTIPLAVSTIKLAIKWYDKLKV